MAYFGSMAGVGTVGGMACRWLASHPDIILMVILMEKNVGMLDFGHFHWVLEMLPHLAALNVQL